MHAGGEVGDQTTGSLVVTLRQGKTATIWCTGASTPCIAAFKPVFLCGASNGSVFENEADAKQFWLSRETIHRGALAGMVDVSALRSRIREMETRWIEQEQKLFASGTPDTESLIQFSTNAAQEECAMAEEFLPKSEIKMKENSRFGRYWSKKNAVLGKE